MGLKKRAYGRGDFDRSVVYETCVRCTIRMHESITRRHDTIKHAALMDLFTFCIRACSCRCRARRKLHLLAIDKSNHMREVTGIFCRAYMLFRRFSSNQPHCRAPGELKLAIDKTRFVSRRGRRRDDVS